MRFDVDEVRDSIYHVLEALSRFELAVAVILVGGGVGAGVAILLGLVVLPAVLIGATLATVGLVALWIRARRQDTTVFGDD